MNSKLIFSLAICGTAFFGDYMVFKSKMAESFAFRAACDSFVHASLGLLSALLFFCEVSVSSQAKLYNVLYCTGLSSLIDIDHVFVARSMLLKDYAHLKQRGILHCTTFWMIITGIILVYSNISRKLNIYVLAWMSILAFTSHHIRDANRRGLWLYPYGHTAPLPKYIYVPLICILPAVFAYVYPHLKPPDKQTILHY